MNSFLTPRLLAITELVSPGAKVLDVGTDHAYVPVYLVKENKALYALATDINDGPLRRAEENILRFCLQDRIKTQKANGLKGVDITKFDTVVIAGMGGILISEILDVAESLEGKTLILQPMTATMELRKYLNEQGFTVLTERIVQEEEKLYVILKAVLGKETPYSDKELLIGRQSQREALYPALKAEVLSKLKKRLSGLMAAKEKNDTEIERLKKIIKEFSA